MEQVESPVEDPQIEQTSENGQKKDAARVKRRWHIRRPRLHVPTLENQISLIFSILLKAVLFVLLFGFAWLIYKGLTSDRYTLKEFEVPQAFAEGGFTGTVLAHQVQDRLTKVQRLSSELRSDSLQISAGEEPEMNVAVMGFGISLQSVIYYARDVMGKENRSIGGELTELDGELSFRVRMTGEEAQIFTEDLQEMTRSEALESLMKQVAEHIMKVIDPQTLALFQSFQGRHDDGLETIRYIINERKEELDWAYWTWGYILFKQQNMAEAEQKVKKATQINPKRQHYWAFLAMLQRIQRNNEGAFETLERGVRENPDAYNLWHNLAWVYVASQEYEKADSAILRAIELNPEVDYLYTNRGEINLQRMNHHLRQNPDTTFLAKDTAAVLGYFQNSFELNKENSDGAFAMYMAYQFAQKEDSALKMLNLAVDLNPNNGWAWRILHIKAFNQTRYEESIALGRSSINAFSEMDPTRNSTDYKYRRQEIWNRMAMAKYNLQEYDSALLYVRRAIAIDTNSSAPYTTLAETYGFMGKREAFYQAMEKGLEKGFNISILLGTEPYNRYEEEPRFHRLKEKYQDK